MQYIIGVDIGTSGTKALAFTPFGVVLNTAYVSYQTISWHPDQQELDPATLLSATIQVIKETVEKANPKNELLGIGFSCALHSVIAVNENGSALTNALTWADSRSKEYAAILKNTALGIKIYEHTGTPLHPMSPLFKLMWFRDKQPDIFTKAHKFISIKEYIWFAFFGKYQVDFGIASGTGLFDIYEMQWYPISLQQAGINADRLSFPVPPTHIEKELVPSMREKMGLGNGIPFIIGGTDGCLANLGSSAINPGDLALTIGTSGAVRMVSSKPKADPKQRIFNYVLTENLFVSGGAINNGGLAIKWYVENFMGKNGIGTRDLGEIVKTTDKIAAGSEGLIFLPYLLGERAPVWDANAKGVFFGIYSGHTSAHFLRAVIEGISFSLFQVGRCLEETVGPIEKIYASGGFIQSPSWLQMVADIFNKKVFVTNSADASAIGAAILGLFALKEINDLFESRKMVRIQETYHPIESNHRTYMKNFSVFDVLYEKLKSEFTELSNFKEEK
jgi:gluconokinase